MGSASETRQVAERFLAAANAHDIDGMIAMWEPGAVEHFATFRQRH